jgi:hypothetical protein
VGARSSDCTCWISAVRVQLLDPVPTTPEKVYVRVLAGCSTPGGSTVIFQAPLPPPSGGFPSTPTTFTIPTGPLQVPCDGFFVGVYLPMPMPLGDGIRVLAAPYVGAIGDNPRPGSPGHAWYFDSGWQTSAHSLHFGVEVANPVLNMGNRDTPHRAVPFQDSYGAGGLYPDLARVAPVSSDQLLARVFDFPNPNALWLLLISVSGGGNCCTAMPVPIPLDAGCLYVLPDVVLGPYVLDAQGAGYLTFPPLTPAIQGLNVCFQAAVLPPTGLVRLSNAQSVSF